MPELFFENGEVFAILACEAFLEVSPEEMQMWKEDASNREFVWLNVTSQTDLLFAIVLASGDVARSEVLAGYIHHALQILCDN